MFGQADPAGSQVNVRLHPPTQKKIGNKNEQKQPLLALVINRAAKQLRTTTDDDLVGSHYLDPTKPGSFGGLHRLLKNSKIPWKKSVGWLVKEPTYTLHKPVRKNYNRQATKVFGVDKQWQADLVGIQKFRRYNNRFGYIDVFSKYAPVVPIKKTVVEL